jgi:hypothetical protein
MRRRRILLLSAGLLVAILLALAMQDVIRQAVVTPLAYLWWLLKLAYGFVPQVLQWILLLVVITVIAITSLLKSISTGRKYAQTSKPTQGAVEILAEWISNSRNGNYYKWMIANRLGKLNGEMSDGEEHPGRPARPEEGATLAVQRYLQAGLDESFVDYPRPALPFLRRKATPFDLNIDEAVGFLESYMEERNGRKHD